LQLGTKWSAAMAAALFAMELPSWWLSAMIGTIFIVAASALMLPGMTWGEKSQVKESVSQSKSTSKRKSGTSMNAKQEALGRLEDEPWFPLVEYKCWQEAEHLQGCPWCFDGCETVEDVIKSIWRSPLHTGLQQALSALLSRVKDVRVARVHNRIPDEIHFAIVYSLKSGAELFGGQPLDLSIGLDLDSSNEPGLRRRRVHNDDLWYSEPPAAVELDSGLPCLAPFYRIHDGFGCLLSSNHLPLLLANPSDSVQGSCYYVYPTRWMQPVRGNQHLVKFARVDKLCTACADCRDENPHVVFAETNGDITEDDEPPLDFVADTVCNIAGQKVVPDGLSYHAYSGSPVF
jgi:hypothetical protein